MRHWHSGWCCYLDMDHGLNPTSIPHWKVADKLVPSQLLYLHLLTWSTDERVNLFQLSAKPELFPLSLSFPFLISSAKKPHHSLIQAYFSVKTQTAIVFTNIFFPKFFPFFQKATSSTSSWSRNSCYLCMLFTNWSSAQLPSTANWMDLTTNVCDFHFLICQSQVSKYI